MASKLPLPGLLAGQTVYAVLRDLAGTVWNGSGMVAYVAANFATYAVAVDNTQNAAGCYLLTFPALPAGVYSVEARYQAGASPAVADSYAGSGFFEVDATGTVILVASRLATSGYAAPLDAAGTRGALGLAAANLDTQLASIGLKTQNLPASPAATGDPMTLTTSERNAVAAALLDLANGVEAGVTPREALRAMAAALAGQRSNVGTDTEQYDAIGNPGTPRILSNEDADGNGNPTLSL